MTRQEAEQILIHYDDLVWQRDNHITCGMIAEALNLATDALSEPTQEELIDKACEWLKDQMHIGSPERTGNIYATTFLSVTPDFLGEFRKAMEAVVKESLTTEYDAEYLQSKIDLHTKYMQEHGITSEQQLAKLDEMRGRGSETPTNPWHKVSEELPKMAHFTADGDYSDLCVCINESGEHKILVLCEQGDYTYWAYGYDGEGLYDEEMDGGEIVKWMKLPKED